MQINRLFEIIYILLNNERKSAKELADKLEVSTRTIYRDIETLSSAGIPIYMTKGKNGGISLLPDFILNKALLNNDEKNEVITSLMALNAIPENQDSNTLNKISAIFGEKNTNWIEIDFSNWKNGYKNEKYFETLKTAIMNKKLIEINYINQHSKSTIRKVEPLRLYYKGFAIYLYGFCQLKEDFRFFKITRIKELKILDEYFNRVLNEPLQKNYRPKEEFINLKLKISKEVAYMVYDEFENFEKDANGDFIVDTIYPKGNFLIRYLLSYGHYLEILEPPSIQDEFKMELNNILKKYL